MAVQDGDHQLFVHYVEGPQQLSVIGEPGKLGPLHCTGQGKALVAFAPAAERERLLTQLELVPMHRARSPTATRSGPTSTR